MRVPHAIDDGFVTQHRIRLCGPSQPKPGDTSNDRPLHSFTIDDRPRTSAIPVLSIACPNPIGPCLKPFCISDSGRLPFPASLWCGIVSGSRACESCRELWAIDVLRERLRQRPQPCRSAPRPTCFPNLLPYFHCTPPRLTQPNSYALQPFLENLRLREQAQYYKRFRFKVIEVSRLHQHSIPLQ